MDQPFVTGALASAVALKYAAEIAAAVRAMHQQRRAHGALGLEYIRLGTSGAVLLPPPESATDARMIDDVTAFGAVLFQLLTGEKPGEIGDWQSVFGTTGLRASGLELAERCMAATVETGPDMQKASTELRLLLLLARHPRCDPSPIAMPKPPIVLPAMPPLRPVPPIAFPSPPPSPASPPAPPAAPPAALPPSAPQPVPRQPFSSASTKVNIEDVWAEPPPTGSRCPKCEGYHVHPSKARTTIETILHSLKFPIYRCHFCYYRFVDVYGMRAGMNRK